MIQPSKNAKAGAVAVTAAIENAGLDELITSELSGAVQAMERRMAALRNSYDTQVRALTQEWEGQLSALSARLASAAAESERLMTKLNELEIAAAGAQTPVSDGALADTPESDAITPTVPIPPKPLPATSRRRATQSLLRGQRLVDWLSTQGIEVIDKRDRPKGSLWITGSRTQIAPIIDALRGEGVVFTYTQGGSRATRNRPGWFTKDAR